MKKLWLILPLLLVAALLGAGMNSIPRVYIQKLVLENGANPEITISKDKSAAEYKFSAWILERPKEVINTDKFSVHHLAITHVGGNEFLPLTVVCKVNLGNFPSNWSSGETLHLKLTHKKTKKTVEWDVPISEGTNLINMLDTPQIIPPFAKNKK